MYGLRVLGIDSSTTNTYSAKTRAERLEKHWAGLVRNAREDADRGFKVRRGKNYRGRLRRRQKSDSESASASVISSNYGDDLEINLESIFREDPPSPPSAAAATSVVVAGSLTPDDNDSGESNKVCDSLVIYLSEPRVRRPRNESQSSTSAQEASNTLYRPVTHYVTTDTDLSELARCHLLTEPAAMTATDQAGSNAVDQTTTSDADQAIIATATTTATAVAEKLASTSAMTTMTNDNIMLTGLHTCGNLAGNMLQLFIGNRDARVLCNVGCCYHLLEEHFVRNPFLENGKQCYVFLLWGMWY